MATESPFFDLYERDSIATKRANEAERERSTYFAYQVWGRDNLPENPLQNLDRSVSVFKGYNKSLQMSQPMTKLGGRPVNAV